MNINTLRGVFGNANTEAICSYLINLPEHQLADMAIEGLTLEGALKIVLDMNKLDETMASSEPDNEWILVSSSSLLAIRYSQNTYKLDIRFQGQSELNFYRYSNVEQFHFHSLLDADSAGSYFSRYIKGQYKSILISEDGIVIPVAVRFNSQSNSSSVY